MGISINYYLSPIFLIPTNQFVYKMGLMCSECVERKHQPKELYTKDNTMHSKEEVQDFIETIKENSGKEKLELYKDYEKVGAIRVKIQVEIKE